MAKAVVNTLTLFGGAVETVRETHSGSQGCLLSSGNLASQFNKAAFVSLLASS